MLEQGNYSYATIRELVDEYFSLQWCRENIVVPLGIDFNKNIGTEKLTVAIGNLAFLATIGDFIKYRAEAGGLECQFIELAPNTIEDILDHAAREKRIRNNNPFGDHIAKNDDSKQIDDDATGLNFFDHDDFQFDDIESDQLADILPIDLSSDPSESKVEHSAKKILIYMHHSGTSDLVIEPGVDEYRLRTRHDGLMQHPISMSHAAGFHVIACIKKMATMDHLDQFSFQKGTINCTHEGHRMTLLCSTIGAKKGEIIIVKKIRIASKKLTLNSLITNNQICNDFRSMINQGNGVIMIAGPRGAGKSTTLAAVLQDIDSDERRTVTAEDPITYDLGGHIQQVSIDRSKGQTYAELLSHFVEQDADTIFIGEAVDPDTAASCLAAAEKGHLIFTTLHTSNAACAIKRLIDMKIPSHKINASLRGVLAQQLLRKVCPECSSERPINEQEAQLTTLPTGTIVRFARALNREEQQQRKDSGTLCALCHGRGYHGRIAAYEFLQINPSMMEVINASKSTIKIQEEAIKNGMTTLRSHSSELIRQKLTTISEFTRIYGAQIYN
ncbi:GspE/PulE family protein [Synechococcus sp. MIT S1220]|uniref:GspE/PulE family protein n=1 Tax=Synechococcus sp. MIT S1220 TaxID=3082549 RepID=UPI0039B0DF85